MRKIDKNFITIKWYKDFEEILNDELKKLNSILENQGEYILEVKKGCLSLHFKDKENGLFMQSLAFWSDREIINWIKGNLNFYSLTTGKHA